MRLRFGEVEFDSVSRQIRRAGLEVHVTTKAFELLKLLLDRRPDAVPKADIQRHLWPDTFVSETNLPALVAEVRAAIGDDARRPQFVRTLHGFGYAFKGKALAVTSRQLPAPGEGVAAGWLVSPGARIPVFSGENVLGREGLDIIVLESPTVSRRHARLIIDEEVSSIEDLGSKNGTYVNDQRVTSTVHVVDGDSIRIGSLAFTFRIAGPVTSTETQETPPL